MGGNYRGIQKSIAEGAFISTWGTEGTGDGEFILLHASLWHLAVADTLQTQATTVPRSSYRGRSLCSRPVAGGPRQM